MTWEIIQPYLTRFDNISLHFLLVITEYLF